MMECPDGRPQGRVTQGFEANPGERPPGGGLEPGPAQGLLARLKRRDPKAVGARQTLKALHKGLAQVVFVAADASPSVTDPIVGACRRANVPTVYVESMESLGRACGIDVGASVAALLDPEAGDEKTRGKGGG